MQMIITWSTAGAGLSTGAGSNSQALAGKMAQYSQSQPDRVVVGSQP
jgi:hypothetical protein